MREATRTVVEKCLGIRKSETVMIITDQKTSDVEDSLFEAAKHVSRNTVLVKLGGEQYYGSQLPALVAEAMKRADVIIAATSKSVSHTRARLEATKRGARIASMPGITKDLMYRIALANYEKIKDASFTLADLLSKGDEARLTTPAGTDLLLSIVERQGLADTGLLHKKGAFGNLPAGEACIAPVEGSVSGIAIVDGSMAGIGMIKTPIEMVIEEGYVTRITGGVEARKLSELVKDKGEEAKNIAELGIGTNESAILSGKPLEDEKVQGTVHIAIGDNRSFGGKVEAPIHLDGIMRRPTLVIDGNKVIEEGNHLIV